MKQTGGWNVGLMLVRKIFQGWYITAITVVAEHAVFCEGGLSEFSDGSLFDIGRDLSSAPEMNLARPDVVQALLSWNTPASCKA